MPPRLLISDVLIESVYNMFIFIKVINNGINLVCQCVGLVV